MSNPEDAGYHIEDPRPIAAQARYTYFLPAAREIEAVQQGDLVKLLFQYDGPTETYAAERMWVLVSEVDGSRLRGTLENRPFEPLAPVQPGDAIRFCRHDILSIQWADPTTAPAPEPVREYWDRCLVDDCVLDGTEPVEYLYREEPELAGEGDTYPDSGWRIRGRMGDANDPEIEARKPRYVALGAVLNRDDSWLHLIDAPVGSRFLRDFEEGTYQPES